MKPMETLEAMKGFIGIAQARTMIYGCRGEEGDYFRDKLAEYGERIATMPVTYEQDGKGDDTIAYLHYFVGSCDWYITEKDSDPVNDAGGHDGQIQAFGLADLGYGAELGYISITEVISAGAELDLHFTPCTLAQLKETRQTA